MSIDGDNIVKGKIRRMMSVRGKRNNSSKEFKDVKTMHAQGVDLQHVVIRNYGGKKDYDYLIIINETWLWGSKEHAIRLIRTNAEKLQKIIAFDTILESV